MAGDTSNSSSLREGGSLESIESKMAARESALGSLHEGKDERRTREIAGGWRELHLPKLFERDWEGDFPRGFSRCMMRKRNREGIMKGVLQGGVLITCAEARGEWVKGKEERLLFSKDQGRRGKGADRQGAASR